jgi:hypothetical protein
MEVPKEMVHMCSVNDGMHCSHLLPWIRMASEVGTTDEWANEEGVCFLQLSPRSPELNLIEKIRII